MKSSSYPHSFDETEFKDKRVLVTGGTKGIGEAIVHRMMLGGAMVATTARSAFPDGPQPTLAIKADLGTVEGVQIVVDHLLKEWGGIDILVNNVGGGAGSPKGGYAVLNEEIWRDVLNLNLLAAVRLDRSFLPGMMERRFGVIIHISSILHRMPTYDSGLAYAAAKAALVTYSKGLAHEVGSKGVRVNVISPGFIETQGGTWMIGELAKSKGIDMDAARKLFMEMIGGIPVGRPGRPDEVAELAAFLASDRAASIHGSDYAIDGGSNPTI